MVIEVAPTLAPLIPLIGALFIGLFGRRPNLREGVTLITGLLLLLFVVTLIEPVLSGARPGGTWFEVIPGLSLAFEVDALGLIYALVASALWIFNSLYSIGYMRALREENQTRYYICFAVAISSAIAIAFSANLFTMFIFYEVLTFSTYPLVTHKRTPEAIRGGRIYLAVLLGTSTCLLLFAVIWTWVLTGTLEFQAGGFLAEKATPTQMGILLTLFVLGTGKAAVMPFHFWLPAAMVAPTPVSAFLHAVAVVKAGVFIVLKIAVSVVGLETIAGEGIGIPLAYLAATTIIVGGVVALAQDNLKARLAYSTISQLSYIVLAATLGNALSITGGGFHIVTHAFAKITLFFCAGAIYVATKKTRVSELSGIGRVMPYTMFAFLVASLSIVGLPPLGGAWSKWFLILGTLEADQFFFLIVYLLGSLLSLAYLLPIPIRAFFGPREESSSGEEVQEAPLLCLIPLLITAGGCFALFVMPDLIYRIAAEGG